VTEVTILVIEMLAVTVVKILPIIVVEVLTVIPPTVRSPVEVSYGPFHEYVALFDNQRPLDHSSLYDDRPLDHDRALNNHRPPDELFRSIVFIGASSLVARRRRPQIGCQYRHRCQ
jgi:hypothetical protein